MSENQIDYYLSINSTWSFLGIGGLADIARHAAKLVTENAISQCAFGYISLWEKYSRVRVGWIFCKENFKHLKHYNFE